MALGAWRSQELGLRIVRHEARVNAARFANWEQDEQIVAAELGKRLADDPEAAVARLQRSSAGCDWLIGRWLLLGNALKTADEGGPGCTWTDAEVALALNLLGRPMELRHLDDWTGRLQSLSAQADSGSEAAVSDLREIIADQVAKLEAQREETWEGIEKPQLEDWWSGVDIDLGPEGTRLRRYEAAADRLFRSAWTKLERLRQERGEPLMPCSQRGLTSEPAVPAPPAAAAPLLPKPLRHLADLLRPSPLDEASSVVDFWAGGAPQAGPKHGSQSRNKTNPGSSRPMNVGRTEPRHHG
jgi:hypothetical protein